MAQQPKLGTKQERIDTMVEGLWTEDPVPAGSPVLAPWEKPDGLPVNIKPLAEKYTSVSEDDLLRNYYSKQLNNARPLQLGQAINALPEGPVKEEYKEYPGLKNYAEYVQDRQFYNNREEQMPKREYFPPTYPQRLEQMNFLGVESGHDKLLKRQGLREMIQGHNAGDEEATKQLLQHQRGPGAV